MRKHKAYCTPKEIEHRLFVRRIGRIFMYAGLTVSGLLVLFAPRELFVQNTPAFAYYSWGVAFTLSALICLVGTLADRWIAEYTAIPMLATTLILCGLGALADDTADAHALVVFALGLITLSFAAGLFARWRDIQVMRKASVESAREQHMRGSA